MDFLDPVKRRRHIRRLMIGYVLVAVLILIIGRFFVIWASGESFNPRTGKIIDYGLLFIDSKPGNADVFLNKDHKGTTAGRYNLPAGTYDITLTKDGYFEWHNKISLAGQSVDRVVYPFLFPKAPKTQAVKAYASLPAEASSSPDRRWLIVEQTTAPGIFSFDLFDTSKTSLSPSNLAVPAGLLTNTALQNQSLTVVRWASDNNHFLLRHDYEGGSEFIVMSRTDPVTNINLSRQYGINAGSADFNAGRFDQVYLYAPSDQTLNLVNSSRNTTTVLLKKVSDWKAIENNLVLYSTADGAPAGQILIKIWDNGKSYKLTSLPIANSQQFDAKQYQSHWYYALGNESYGRIVIYKDPLDSLKDPNNGKVLPLLSIVTPGTPLLSFSKNSRFIEAQSGQQFNVYDAETQTRYKYSLTLSTAPMLGWMDGHRLIGDINDQVFVMDFDAQNQHSLIKTASAEIEFDSSWNHMYSFGLASAGGAVELQSTDMRAGNDLPKP